jgi:hypothetical protein
MLVHERQKKIEECQKRFQELCWLEFDNLNLKESEFKLACKEAVESLIDDMSYVISRKFEHFPETTESSFPLERIAESIKRLPKLKKAFSMALRLSAPEPNFVFIKRQKTSFYGSALPFQVAKIKAKVGFYEPFAVQFSAPEFKVTALLWKSGKPYDKPRRTQSCSSASIEIVHPQELADAFLTFLVIGSESPGVRK